MIYRLSPDRTRYCGAVTVVTGSVAQTVAAEPGRLGCAPAGAVHVVDLDHPANAAGAHSGLAYAACGTPVLVWAATALPTEEEILLDPACAALSHRARQSPSHE